MMITKQSRYYAFSFAILLNVVYTSAEEPQGILPIPYVEKNVCPFECCQFGKWTAKSAINAYVIDNKNSKIAFKVRPNDILQAITGNLYIDDYGQLLITKPIYNFKKKDRVLALHCVDEGAFLLWNKGVFSRVEIFWDTNPQVGAFDVEPLQDSKYFGLMLKEPSMTWWVKVENTRGQSGWLNLRNTTSYCFGFKERIEGMDACE